MTKTVWAAWITGIGSALVWPHWIAIPLLIASFIFCGWVVWQGRPGGSHD